MKVVAKKASSQEEHNTKRFRTQYSTHSSSKNALAGPNFQSIIQLKPGCPCGGGCPRCKEEESLQAKLKIGEPNYKYEQEADRVAEQVMRMPDSEVDGISKGLAQIQRKCAAWESGEGLCPKCAEEEEIQRKLLTLSMTPLLQRQIEEPEEEEVEEFVQAKETPGQTPKVSSEIAGNINALKSGGQPLPATERAFFEPRFGHDFSQVRVHSDARAAESARSVHARAFTVGPDVVFGAGEYAPGMVAGRRLLAHELTHVVQQGSGAASQHQHIQRQQLPPDVLEELIKTFKIEISTEDIEKVIKKIKEFFGKEEVICPTGFKPATASGLEGLCCKEGTTIQNTSNCCAPSQIAQVSKECCPEGTLPDPAGKECKPFEIKPCPDDAIAALGTCVCFPPSREHKEKKVCCPKGQVPFGELCVPTCPLDKITELLKSPACFCPPEREDTKNGICCPEGQAPDGAGGCKIPSKKEEPPPKKELLPPVKVFFEHSRPRPGEFGEKSLNASLTSKGRTNLDKLVTQLRQNPSHRVQLIGKASPEGTKQFNMDLSARRAHIIALALQRQGIGRSRIATAPGSELPDKGCIIFDQRLGLVMCGEFGATSVEDRQVFARFFLPANQQKP